MNTSLELPAYIHFGSRLEKTVLLLPDQGEDYSFFG